MPGSPHFPIPNQPLVARARCTNSASVRRTILSGLVEKVWYKSRDEIDQGRQPRLKESASNPANRSCIVRRNRLWMGRSMFSLLVQESRPAARFGLSTLMFALLFMTCVRVLSAPGRAFRFRLRHRFIGTARPLALGFCFYSALITPTFGAEIPSGETSRIR